MTVIAYKRSEELSQSDTADWVEKLSVSGGLQAGSYEIKATCEFSSSLTTVSASVRVMLDGNAVNTDTYLPPSAYDPHVATFIGVLEVECFTQHSLSIEYKPNGAATAFIRHARLFIERSGG
jgi:hypothetical protein